MPEPIYIQVADDLRRKISEDDWPVGYQLPGLQILAEHYKCSWGTIRAAQEVLVKEGVLSPVRTGMATTVARRPSGRSIEQLMAQLQAMRQTLDETIDSLKRELAERQRAQAVAVTIRQEVLQPERGKSQLRIVASVMNSSDRPVHDVKIKWHRGSAEWGEPSIEDRGALPPGYEITSERAFPTDTNLDVSGAVVTFRDAAGIGWLRRPDGELMEWYA